MNEARFEPTLAAMPTLDQAPADAEVEIDQAADVPGRTAGSRHRRHMRWLIALLAVCAAIALWSVLWQPQTVSQLPAALPKAAPPAPEAPAKPRFPIESTASALPALDASDAAMLAVLQALWSGGGLASILEPRDIVRNIVVTVDNLPRRALPSQRMPVRPVPGSFGTASSGNGLVIGERNALRYAPYVRLLEVVDAPRLVSAYVQYYPLFQQAYRELGYPNGHFNDRLVEAIDVLIATPEPTTAHIPVVQPKIFYQFADPELEKLPAGQKLLLRMGTVHANRVKERLRDIRALVTVQATETAAVAPAGAPQAATPR